VFTYKTFHKLLPSTLGQLFEHGNGIGDTWKDNIISQKEKKCGQTTSWPLESDFIKGRVSDAIRQAQHYFKHPWSMKHHSHLYFHIWPKIHSQIETGYLFVSSDSSSSTWFQRDPRLQMRGYATSVHQLKTSGRCLQRRGLETGECQDRERCKSFHTLHHFSVSIRHESQSNYTGLERHKPRLLYPSHSHVMLLTFQTSICGKSNYLGNRAAWCILLWSCMYFFRY